MLCSHCQNATAVYLHGGMYYECSALRAMKVPYCYHKAWQIQVYMGKIYVPKECPITDAGINAKNRGSWVALFEATRSKSVRAVCKVLGSAAEQQTETFNDDALRWAVTLGHDEVIPVLLNWGADVNKKYTELCPGRTPLMLTAENNHAKTVKLLLNWGAKFHTEDDNGDTALVIAAKRGLWPIMDVLADYGADWFKRDRFGMSAAARAIEYEINREAKWG